MMAVPAIKTQLKAVNFEGDDKLKYKNVHSARRVSFCQRFGKFALNVGSMVGAGLALHRYLNPKR